MRTPPAAPTVLIDETLREYCQSLKFDYQAFYSFARAAGFTDKDITTYTIHFRTHSPYGLAGRYLPRPRTAEIYLGDILDHRPENTGKLRPDEHQLSPSTQYSRVVSRVVAHETGHHSRAGRTRGKLRTASTNGLLAAPLATAGIGTLYTSVTGSLVAPLLALAAETGAVATLSYQHARRYRASNTPEKVFTHHHRRFSEQPAFAAESHTPATPLVKIRLK